MSEKKDVPESVIKDYLKKKLFGEDRGTDSPRVSYVKSKEKDPFEMKAKRRPGIIVKERALKFRRGE
ncbi:hypothetical protein LCGC14_2689620 [marine sediment metagenome]|uniref:Uncharacterized protein n=1 Tax=marine sediment metagenome TaxID=412755 RepID=A0A0F9BTJ5_9ZZZZ